MKHEKYLPISLFILSLSIIFASIWIPFQLNSSSAVHSSEKTMTDKVLLTKEEAAGYLNLSIDDFNNMITNQIIERSKMPSYATYTFIPYIEINRMKYFNKEQIDKWVEQNMLQYSQIK